MDNWDSDLTLLGGFDLWTIIHKFLPLTILKELNTTNKESYDIFTTTLHETHKLRAMKLVNRTTPYEKNSGKLPTWIRRGDFVIMGFPYDCMFIFDGNILKCMRDAYDTLDISDFPSLSYFVSGIPHRNIVFKLDDYIYEKEYQISAGDRGGIHKFTHDITKKSLFILGTLGDIRNHTIIQNSYPWFYACSIIHSDIINNITIKKLGITEHNLCVPWR